MRKPATGVPATIDEYIASAAPTARPRLKEIRRIVRQEAPDADEVISYRMPAFRQQRIVIYFAAFQRHIGIFPPVSGDAKLLRDLAPFAGPKGNLRFPLDKPMPHALIRRVVKHRLKSNNQRIATKSPRKKASGTRTSVRRSQA